MNDGVKAKTPPELSFAAHQFSKYYSVHRLKEVPGLKQREFGFMFFDKGFVHRHIGFQNTEELRRYLVERNPAHAYYSTAYYERPDAGTMAEKGWTGADLIFDLDADHVRGSEKLPYEQMLARVKEVMIRLYDEFVCSDLGYGERDTEIVFSGGRGYHIHVYGEDVKKLGSHERREIVDYVTAGELDLDILLSSKAIETERNRKQLKSTRLPALSEGGWYGKTRKALNMLLEQLLSLPEEGAIELLVSAGIKKSQAARIYRQVQDRGGRERMLSENILDALTDRDDDLKKFKSVLQSKAVEWLGGQTDEPVTSDTHRLIRLPGSLHGKTALKVVSLTRDQLATFDPLRDAVPDFGDETVLVHSAREFVAEPLGGHALAIREGLNEIPLPLGLFLILRRQVTLAPKQ